MKTPQNGEWYRSELEEVKLIAKIQGNRSLRRIFKNPEKYNHTIKIKKDMREKLNGVIDNFFTCFIKGHQGSMKTTSAIEIARDNDQDYNCDRISFEYQEFREKFSKSSPRQIFQIDEQLFKRGTGSQRLIQEIQEIIESLRQRQNSLIICSPEKKYFPEDLFTYYFETVDNAIIATCKENSEPHEPRRCKCWYDKENPPTVITAWVRLALKEGDRYYGFYHQQIEWGNQTYQEYNLRKVEFMERLKEGDRQRTDYEKMALDIIQDPASEEYKNKKQLRILVEKKKPNLTVNETDLVIEAISMARSRKKWEKPKPKENEETG